MAIWYLVVRSMVVLKQRTALARPTALTHCLPVYCLPMHLLARLTAASDVPCCPCLPLSLYVAPGPD
jgi:hypothetical protein